MSLGTPGFQKSEHSWVEVILYQHGDDPIVLGTYDRWPFTGKGGKDSLPSLISVQTSKVMGAPSGQFTFQVKPPIADRSVGINLFEQIEDDGWLDIIFYKHNQPQHVMRGLIDTIRGNISASGTGATTETYTISGRDFGKIWEQTPIWFSPYADDDLTVESVTNLLLDYLPQIKGSPAEAVQVYMEGFLEKLSAARGPDWKPPASMPGIAKGNFLDSVKFDTKYYKNIPARKTFNPSVLDPKGTLWSLAQHYSDPAFTELFVDILPNYDFYYRHLEDQNPFSPEDTAMTVVVRDKPFPVTDSFVIGEGYADAWDDLPTQVVTLQEIASLDVGKSGLERFNAYYVSTLLTSEELGAHAMTLLAPLVDLEDIRRHGVRRMDVQSSLSPDDLDFGKFSKMQRLISRDWYCLNPYFLAGNINLGVGRPDLKIGCKLRVPGRVEDTTYYIESVSNTWALQPGVRTSIGVTRGWLGTDATYKEAISKLSRRYKVYQDSDRRDISIVV